MRKSEIHLSSGVAEMFLQQIEDKTLSQMKWSWAKHFRKLKSNSYISFIEHEVEKQTV